MRNIMTCGVILIAACSVAASLAPAATIKSSPVCAKDVAECLEFGAGEPIPTIAHIKFTASGAGTALVSFNGSMQCRNSSITNDINHGVVDLTSGILMNSETPDYQSPGGSRIAVRIPAGGAGAYSVPVNLASSRVVALTAGQYVFTFKISPSRMDEDTSCIVYNGNFNIVFVP